MNTTKEREMKYETFETVEIPEEPTAEDIVRLVNEQFTNPEVIEVVASFEHGMVEFDISHAGALIVSDGGVESLLLDIPDPETLEDLRVRKKPWLSDVLEELSGAVAGDILKVEYVSRFGDSEKTTEKSVSVEEVIREYTDEPYGYGDDNVDMVGVFGFEDGSDFMLLVESNVGVNVMMNNTRIVEPETVPEFEVVRK